MPKESFERVRTPEEGEDGVGAARDHHLVIIGLAAYNCYAILVIEAGVLSLGIWAPQYDWILRAETIESNTVSLYSWVYIGARKIIIKRIFI